MPLLLLIPLFFLLMHCSGDDKQIVARIGSEKITEKEFRDKLIEEYRGKDLAELSEEEKLKTLNNMLELRRKVLWAKEKGLENDPAYLAELEIHRNRSLAIALYNKIVIDEMLPESMIKQFYEWKNTEVEAVVIQVGFKDARIVRHDRPEEEAQRLALEYREKLAASSDPNKTAEEFTDNKRVSVLLKPYNIGRFEMRVDSVVFRGAAGEVVGPVKSDNHGFLIFKILNKKPLPGTGTYETAKGELKQVLRGQMRQKEKNLFDSYSEEFQQKFKAEFFDEGMSRFLEAMKEWGQNQNRQVTDFTPEQREIELARIADKSVRAGEFIDFFKGRLINDFRKFQTRDDLKNGYVQPQINLLSWAMAAESRNYAKEANVQNELEKFRIQRLSQVFEQKAVDEDVEVSEEEIQNYYADNAEKYMVPEKIKVWQISVKDHATAQEVIRKAKSGADFQSLHKQYVSQKQGRAARFELGFQNRNSQFKEVVKKAFEVGSDQVAGPVEVDGTLCVIKTGEHTPESLKPLKAVRGSITAAIANQKKNNRRDALLEELRQKYAYRINDYLVRRIS
jgi:hypothetical protein